MAVRKKNQEKVPQDGFIKNALQQMVGELYDEHAAEIRAVMDDSETRKVAFVFPGTLDFSESDPMLTVQIRFSATVTDKRVCKIDEKTEDPNQIVMFRDAKDMPADGQTEMTDVQVEAAKAEKKGKRVKKLTEEIAEQSEE